MAGLGRPRLPQQGVSLLRWRWLPVPLLLLAIFALRLGPLHAAPPRESALLAGMLGVCFVTIPSLAVSLLCAHSYLATRSVGLLAVMVGSYLWGLGNPIAVLLGKGGINAMITAHNTLAFTAAATQFLGALLPEREGPRLLSRAPRATLLGSYLVTSLFVVAVIGLVEAGLTPVFFVQGRGGTPARQLVLGGAIVLFALTAAVLWSRLRRGAAPAFLGWYVPGLALIALGLFGVWMQESAGGYVSWAGRLSQYVGSVWLVVAALALVRETGNWTLSLEEAARESEARYSTLVELSPDALLVHQEGIITFINAAGVRLFGARDASQIVGRSPLDLVHQDDRELVRGRLGALRAGQPTPPREQRFVRVDGTLVDVEVAAAPFHTSTGPAVQVVARDITERKQAQAALAASEERFRALADDMAQLAWIADESGARTWFNRRWTDYTGLSLEASRGEGWTAAHDPEQAPRLLDRYRARTAAAEPWEESVRLRAADGSWRWFLVRAVPIRDAAGRVTQWFGTDTDITVQHEAEEALRRAVALRDEFLSVASHELRTPLTALELHLEALSRLLPREPGPSAIRAASKAEAATRQAHRLGRLIEDLLSVSRIIDGRLDLRPGDCDLGELVQKTTEELGPVLQQARCEVRLRLEPGLVGHFDAARIDQVVVNLLGNALKYGAGAPIDVEVAREGDTAVLRVTDHGIGIAAGDQERIFSRFERAVSTEHYGGLGLGLYIVRQIVAAHGGTIGVASRPGQGATFEVRLPLGATAAAGGARARA